MADQRREVRMMCADMVEVRWADGENRPRRTLALLEDISPIGACLQLETPISLGTEVRWECPKQSFVGFVRYCQYREIGFFAGVAFADACRWSRRVFNPQHLLDLEALLPDGKK